MKNSLDLSIIIVSYNTKKLLDDCINSIKKSLQNCKLRVEVIVVDNGSKDGSRELISEKYPDVLLISNNENAGFGKANNQAAAKATGKYLFFLNSDTLVIDNAIEKLYEFIKINENSICGGKLFNLDKTSQASCGPEYSLINIFTALFLKGDYLGITRYSPNKIRPVDWIMGACVMMSKEVFDRVGGFDEGIFMYMEEIDFEYRAKLLNIKILFYPDAQFIHYGAASSGRNNAIVNVFKGFKYFYKKHRNYIENLLLAFILVLKSIISILVFSILLNKSKLNLYIKALKIALT